MRTVRLTEPDTVPSPSTARHPLADALGLEHVALNYHVLDPGESFAFGFHAHDEQEEAFLVLEGTATFETESGDVEVGEGELIAFAPGEFQRGRNETDGRVAALALGAPKDSRSGTLRRACPNCGERTEHRFAREDDGRVVLTICLECDEETGRYTA